MVAAPVFWQNYLNRLNTHPLSTKGSTATFLFAVAFWISSWNGRSPEQVEKDDRQIQTASASGSSQLKTRLLQVLKFLVSVDKIGLVSYMFWGLITTPANHYWQQFLFFHGPSRMPVKLVLDHVTFRYAITTVFLAYLSGIKSSRAEYKAVEDENRGSSEETVEFENVYDSAIVREADKAAGAVSPNKSGTVKSESWTKITRRGGKPGENGNNNANNAKDLSPTVAIDNSPGQVRPVTAGASLGVISPEMLQSQSQKVKVDGKLVARLLGAYLKGFVQGPRNLGLELIKNLNKYWPLIQVVNFTVIPLPLRVLYQNVALVGWVVLMTAWMKKK